jgi:hypothetical protein
LAGSRDHPRAPEQIDQSPRTEGRPGRPDHPRVPDSPARADRPDASSPAAREQHPGRPRSAGDERRMRALEALPPGHPSSPYQADGRRRPAEPSLRSLELPMPEERDTGTSDRHKGASQPDGHTGDSDDRYRDAARRYGDPARHGGDAQRGGGNTGRGDWNGGPGGGVDGAGRGTRELPKQNRGQPEEIGDAFVPEGPRGKQGTADNTAGRTRPDNAQTADAMSPPEGMHRSYWTEVPRFKDMWGKHESTWPNESQPKAKVDRSADPPGSWRSDGNLPLSAETNERAKVAIREVYRAEPPVTADLQQITQESPYGAELKGLEFRRKGEERLKEKVAEAVRDNPDAPPHEVVQGIPDTIRYTFSTERDNYTNAYWDIKERLESRGYEMYHSNNSWEKSEYKGINTRWITSDGKRFEVQFHTPESHHAKQEITHKAYERIRNPLTSKVELQELRAFQQEVSSWVPVPPGVTDIPSFRKKGF